MRMTAAVPVRRSAATITGGGPGVGDRGRVGSRDAEEGVAAETDRAPMGGLPRPPGPQPSRPVVIGMTAAQSR